MLRVFSIAMLAVAPAALAQERIADFDNSVRVEYQFIHTGDIDSSLGLFDGATDAHIVLLSGVYSLSPRLKIFGSIPYVQKRYRGASEVVHDPNVDFVAYSPPDLTMVDDGDYHGGFQDASIGMQYLAIDGPFSVSPYISFGAPLRDYPIYGNAIIGKQLWELPIGVSLEFTPYFSDWSFHADIAYVISEKAVGVDLNYWYWHASASYFVTRRFAPRVFLTQRKAPNALLWPEDFSDDLDNEFWFHHDRTLKHAYLNGGIGFDYIVSDRYSISATYFETLDPDHVSEVDYALTFAVSRRF